MLRLESFVVSLLVHYSLTMLSILPPPAPTTNQHTHRQHQIEDLKVVPVEAPKTEAELKLDELLKGAASGAVGSSGGGSGIVNNLNSLVKKKKKVVVEAEEEPVVNQEEEGKEKRKAEDSALGEGEPEEKKVKIDA